MEKGSKPWNRSKILLVGDGRVGKTALCNNMLGKPFAETESTVGLKQLTCDVQRAAASSGQWSVQSSKCKKEFETGVAQVIKDMEKEKHETAVTQESRRLKEKYPSPEVKSGGVNKPTIPGNSQPLTPAVDKRDLDAASTGHNASLLLKSDSSSEHGKGAETTNLLKNSKLNNDSHSIEPDSDLIIKYLADVKVSGTDLILSLFDFGGQSVFNIIHHLFLTSYGVYVVVFNMVDMLDHKQKCLTELSFWINSIVMHTRHSEGSNTAPVFLVGTHKDKVYEFSKHKFISDEIEKRFRQNIGQSVVRNDDLFFFPVNNRISRPSWYLPDWLMRYFISIRQQDDVVKDLMSKIENKVKQSNYVKNPRPLTWLKALDELFASKRSF